MIEHASGNLLEADVEALVNSVNTVGVMGKGVALQFKQAYPKNYEAYRRACKRGAIRPGEIFVFETGLLTNPHFILNFPTKRHWRGKSRIEDIDAGLIALVDVVRNRGITSIAVPPLGCGNGGLAWPDVLPRIETAFRQTPNVRVLIYAPEGAPAPDRMRVATSKPKITPARAALLGLLETYARPGYRVSMLELQKLAYFLQVAGEPLKLGFTRGSYGPYAEQLHHVLQRLEGHYIRGYGDRTRDVSINLIDDTRQETNAALATHKSTQDRLCRVAELIEGFETPYGLELLATVYFVAQEDPNARASSDVATERVHEWSERKRERFSSKHVSVAWSRLRSAGWFEAVGGD